MANERLEEIRQARLRKRQALIDAGRPPYPAEVRRTHKISDILARFTELSSEESAVIILGRVLGIRRHGGLIFIDAHDERAGIQLQATKDALAEDIFDRVNSLDAGDWVQATGLLTKTERGLETIALTDIAIVSKAIRPLPDSWYGLKDHEARFRQREIDLLLNKQVRNVFYTRAKVVQWLRQYLTKHDFLEVETPILQPVAGGAAARPFATHHNTLDIDLFLRIAPELYLKRLLVGGFEKVFEIGRNFRNEGISRQHNPEFTMLEFYWAYADYEDIMDFTEQMLVDVVQEIAGQDVVTWQEQNLSFSTPLPRVRFVDLVNKLVDFDILDEKNPDAYIPIFKREGLEVPSTKTYTKLVDELYKECIRPKLVRPTILYDYPTEMFPLAKQSLPDPRIAETFQLVVAGTEIVKAYTELNDPVLQQQRFEQQQTQREAGDEEAQPFDEEYIQAMEYGMPPVAGFGLGIDRLVMLLTNSPHLRDTILFPILRPKQDA